MSIFDFMKKKNVTTLSTANLSPVQVYERLEEYYGNNSLYDGVSFTAAYNNIYLEALKGLRTPVHRSVEFYTSHVAQEITVTANKQNIQKAIEQFHKWSNLDNSKRLAIRHFALYGDSFYKIVTSPDKVYFESINPKLVTEFEEDNRGNITEIRIDTVVEINEQEMTQTEYWTKGENGNDGYMGIWIHNMGTGVELAQLGEPKEYYSLAEFGIDFIPFVHSKFIDTGKKRGDSCVSHVLLKIDDANRMSTRLEQLLFRYNKATWAVRANATDANGRPIPAPKLNNGSGASDDIDMKDGSMIYLPGNSSLESLIPNINYDSALNILKAMENELEMDLPELRYYSIKDGTLSGKAIRSLLAGAIDKANEAQDNFLNAIKKLDEMALTIGIYSGIYPANLGNYTNGDFEHEISGGELFAIDALEKAQILKELVAGGLPLKSAMKQSGFSEEEITEALEEKSNEQIQNDNLLANSLTKFNAL